MSWLARSLANTLHLDDEEDGVAAPSQSEWIAYDRPSRLAAAESEERDASVANGGLSCSGDEAVHDRVENGDPGCDGSQARGMKDDLSELGDSLKRQLWGVASFLAPPPPRLSDGRSDFSDSISERCADDFDGGVLQENGKSEYQGVDYDQHQELTNISETENAYSDIIDNAAGITEEVLAFARNIAHHPETWLDFPLSEEEEFDDFEISDAQYEHILAIELLAPRLAALRIEFCPIHMSEGYFWMVYFVLLHSRLNKHDADMLSSPQLVEARFRWMHELQKQTKELQESLKMREISESALFREDSHHITPSESPTQQTSVGQELGSIPPTETVAKNNDFLEEHLAPCSSHNVVGLGDTDDDDDWLKEDSDLVGYSAPSIVLNEEDISFSDLEDDFDSTMPIKHRTTPK